MTLSDKDIPESPSSRSLSSSVGETEGNQQNELLTDLNDALQTFVSLSTDKTVRSGEKSGPQITLDADELKGLRKLEDRLRFALKKPRLSFRKVITGDENVRVRDIARSQVNLTGMNVKKGVRKVVTGSTERPLRDWVKQSNVVKAIDKYAFVLGVSLLCATEFVMLKHPEDFGQFFVVVISFMLLLRLYIYRQIKQLYFMIDFCYFVNMSCAVSVVFLRDSPWLWKLNFSMSTTLMGALLAWKNSLVFHSLDKVTSIAVHFLPGLLCYIERWRDDSAMCPPSAASQHCSFGFTYTLFFPLVFYAVWQLMYIFKTEIIDRKRFMDDPSIKTSLRWLTKDTKNGMHKLAKSVCRSIGVLRPDEEFESEALKTKMVFWISQLIFTLVTLAPVPLMFGSHIINLAYVLFVFSGAVYNGANYYFEIFAARYIQKLQSEERKQKVPSKDQ